MSRFELEEWDRQTDRWVDCSSGVTRERGGLRAQQAREGHITALHSYSTA